MATNYIQPGKVIEVEKASIEAGDHVLIGETPGVALTDTNAEGNIQLATEGVFELSVTGADNAGDAAISVGERIYYDGGTLNKDATDGTLFGKVLEAVSSGATATIPVMINQG